jgi:hypothetical protein
LIARRTRAKRPFIDRITDIALKAGPCCDTAAITDQLATANGADAPNRLCDDTGTARLICNVGRTTDDKHRNRVAKRHSCSSFMAKHRIYTTSVSSVYAHYLAKAGKKGRTKAEVDAIIRWLTGYSQIDLEKELNNKIDFETFFAAAPKLNPARSAIKGVICGVRIEDITETTMREIRYLDKMVDELAKGKAMDNIRLSSVRRSVRS